MGETFAASAGDVAVDGVDYVAEIARSDSALVYRGWQPAEQRTVAVKVLGVSRVAPGTLDDVTSLPAHPHLVRVHAVGVNAAGHPYLVMDHLAGGSMDERIMSEGSLPWREALRAGAQLASALEAAHGARLLHLGIKPANVLLSDQGDVCLGDFVTTEIRRRTSAAPSSVSFANVAPEVLSGADPSRASDIFSLGATVFAMITGHPPTRLDEAAVAELRRHQVPEALARVLERALSEDPAARPSSVSFAYVAPEVLGGAKPSRASDIFSLAATVFAMITGHPPTRLDEAAVAELRRHQVPKALARVLGRALAEDPAARPSALGLGRALHDAGESPDRSPPEATEPDEHAPPAGSRRELAWVVVLVMVAAVVAFVVVRQPSTQEDVEPAGDGDQATDQGGDQAVERTPGQGAVAAAAVADLAPFGIEGVAVSGGEVAVSGVEVRSVASPSAAEETGIAADDLITKVAGVALAGDSLSAYELVRGRDPEAPLAVQVLRPAEGVLYEGELEGEALVPVVDRTFLSDLPPGEGPYDTSVRVVDETGALEVAVPVLWTETDVEPFAGLGPNIQAAPDLAEFRDAWSSPGINVTATTERDADDLEGVLATFVEPGGLADCATEGPQPYADGAFSGLVQYFADCGGTSSGFVQVVATPPDEAFVLQFGLQLVDEDDLGALDLALASVYVAGPL
jgi:serine/threonine protein kinase